MIMFAPLTDHPATLRGVCLGPPAIQLRKIQSAINEHFHATRFPRASRRAHRHIDALNQSVRHVQIAVTQEDYPRPQFRARGEPGSLLNHFFRPPRPVDGLPSEHDLDGAIPAGQILTSRSDDNFFVCNKEKLRGDGSRTTVFGPALISPSRPAKVRTIQKSILNHNLGFCYKESRVIQWVLKQALRGMQGVTRSFA